MIATEQRPIEGAAKLAGDVLNEPERTTELAIAHVAERVREGTLDKSQAAALRELLAQYEQSSKPAVSEKSPASAKEIDWRAAAIKEAGGIFIGKDELVSLDKLAADTEIPAIPEKYSQAFLAASHPLRGGTIASHVILGFDPESKQWVCIDRGSGGKSDVVPGSLGIYKRGLFSSFQDKLVEKVDVNGLKLRSPDCYESIKAVLDFAVALHLSSTRSIIGAPFEGIWGRTADTERASAYCRVLLGDSNGYGVVVDGDCYSELPRSNVGLLACWN